MMLSRRSWRVSAWLGAAVLLAGAQVPDCRGLVNRSGAPIVDPNAGSEIFESCTAATLYSEQVERSLQSRCITCHLTGSEGSPSYELNSGLDLSGREMLENYRESLRQLLEDDSDVPEFNPIILSPLVGDNGHKIIFSGIDDADYLTIREWIVEERANPCGLASN